MSTEFAAVPMLPPATTRSTLVAWMLACRSSTSAVPSRIEPASVISTTSLASEATPPSRRSPATSRTKTPRLPAASTSPALLRELSISMKSPDVPMPPLRAVIEIELPSTQAVLPLSAAPTAVSTIDPVIEVSATLPATASMRSMRKSPADSVSTMLPCVSASMLPLPVMSVPALRLIALSVASGAAAFSVMSPPAWMPAKAKLPSSVVVVVRSGNRRKSRSTGWDRARIGAEGLRHRDGRTAGFL